MSTLTFHLEVVSAEKGLFSGDVTKISITGGQGELGIYPNHAPLLSFIKPGLIHLFKPDGDEVIIYLSGGMLEVQPRIVTVLADTAIRGEELDEARALKAKREARERIHNFHGDFNYTHVAAELAKVLAQLRVIELVKKVNRGAT